MSKDRKRTRTEHKGSDDAVALYHAVFENEGFDESAKILVRLVSEAEKKWPGKRRLLYLDIDGHKNSAGGWDHDMLELQQEFVIGFLSPYLSEAHVPLISVSNPNPQRGDVPKSIEIIDKDEAGPGAVHLDTVHLLDRAPTT